MNALNLPIYSRHSCIFNLSEYEFLFVTSTEVAACIQKNWVSLCCKHAEPGRESQKPWYCLFSLGTANSMACPAWMVAFPSFLAWIFLALLNVEVLHACCSQSSRSPMTVPQMLLYVQTAHYLRAQKVPVIINVSLNSYLKKKLSPFLNIVSSILGL